MLSFGDMAMTQKRTVLIAGVANQWGSNQAAPIGVGPQLKITGFVEDIRQMSKPIWTIFGL